MSVSLTQEEQLNNLKGFFSRYSSAILGIIVVVAVGFAGWQYYLKQQDKNYVAGLKMYQQVVQISEKVEKDPANKGNVSNLREAVRKMTAEEPKSSFTVQALLLQAKVENNIGDTKNMVATLQKALTTAENKDGLKQITQIRYARGLLQAGDPNKALQEINKVTDKAFVPSAQEVKGDILLALKNTKGAIEAYELAWNTAVKRDENRPILMLKLQALGVPVTPPKDTVINTGDES